VEVDGEAESAHSPPPSSSTSTYLSSVTCSSRTKKNSHMVHTAAWNLASLGIWLLVTSYLLELRAVKNTFDEANGHLESCATFSELELASSPLRKQHHGFSRIQARGLAEAESSGAVLQTQFQVSAALVSTKRGKTGEVQCGGW
jgi:hypothetical protein